ncbi:nucleotide sugar dehydrogenase [Pinisolibacter aquiterrae]|uniref:nucleotide sugar dehydrogenase n=1 Tax=Pinisolibacter aquiterrae TaxID=2815579 RepID=UPI001C3E00E1|nr:nucleotide sugar dehydrogenase [Pinisolibacter aquiterrae]MBV5265721.1 nucleotide sugar dehydrogenase [Pinisolibacter aquiterrae]MCC8236714.1 nucleotide sugar dehydrogenase [Pinisolibacter aquiterrae]
MKFAVVGLGYVGLPVAVAFAKSGKHTIGFDIDTSRIEELSRNVDRTLEISAEDLAGASIRFTNESAILGEADFFVVTVPTPVDRANQPDLTPLRSASRSVGSAMRKGAIVVYESTVYPGATEEVRVPILEEASGLVCGRDFTVGYSPERINPGDKLHTFETITKVVAGQDQRTLDIVAEVYGSVVKAGIHRASSIKVAEASKVIENSQRDINIAFMNELSRIFHRLGIDTNDVLAAASTKWNFLAFTPGLVGGHCIGVDPYYLTYQSERFGYHPHVILAGRRINDSVGEHIARECVRLMTKTRATNRRVAVLGLTFKENIPDLRNSKVADIINELEAFGTEVVVADPLASPEEAKREYGVTLTPVEAIGPVGAVVFAVSHRDYVEAGWPLVSRLLGGAGGIVLDVKGVLDRSTKPDDITLWRP